jgi:hypothetical protein
MVSKTFHELATKAVFRKLRIFEPWRLLARTTGIASPDDRNNLSSHIKRAEWVLHYVDYSLRKVI